MTQTTGKFGAVSYGLAVLCFFLTFVEFSCGGQRVASFSGIQLVTGTTIQSPNVGGPPQTKPVSSEPAAIIAFVALLAGVVLGFARSRSGLVVACISGVVGAISLFVLKTQMDNEVMKAGGGLIRIEYAAPFWIASLLSVAGAAVAGFAASEQSAAANELPLTPTPEIKQIAVEEAGATGPPLTITEPPFTRRDTTQEIPTQRPIAPAMAVAAAVVYCAECGAKLASDARFCDECGTEL